MLHRGHVRHGHRVHLRHRGRHVRHGHRVHLRLRGHRVHLRLHGHHVRLRLHGHHVRLRHRDRGGRGVHGHQASSEQPC